MIYVYHNLGHEVTFIGAWAHDTFTLSTVLYVDNSNLFHMAFGMPLDEEFLQLVQSATNYWADLVHVTGGGAQATEMLLVHAWLDIEEG